MKTRTACVLSAAMVAFALDGSARASDTTIYTYDPLGRLVNVSTTGGPNNGLAVATVYDPAGNRGNYAVTGASTPPPPGPAFSISDSSVTEGGTLTFTVTKAGTASTTLTVAYATADGSALAGSDYSAASGTLSFAASETSKTISVVTLQDTVAEANETLTVNLSNASGGATLADSQGIGTIVDNDGPNTWPVANSDTLTIAKCTWGSVNVTANDTDADGDYPLAVTGVNDPTGHAYWVSASHLGWAAATPGTYIVGYSIQDSRGGPANGTLTVTVTGTGTC